MRSSSTTIGSKKSWIIDMENKVSRYKANNEGKLSKEESEWRKPSIFRLPEFVRMMKLNVFTPKVVAIGPYHHNKSHLQSLECHKERALLHFLQRGIKPLGDYVRELKTSVEELQGSYVELDEEWKNEDNFLKLMIIDACFMLEVMRLDPDHCKRYYAPNDPFFGFHSLQRKVPYMRRDMLIMENQLPILVFNKLLSVEMNIDEKEAEYMITELVLKFFVPSIYNDKNALTEFKRTNHSYHVLDIYRRSRLFVSTKDALDIYRRSKPISSTKDEQTQPTIINNFSVMRSAIRLHEAGITFKKSKSNSLTTISFDQRHGILTLPFITVDDNTEYEFVNMLALEHLYAECGSEISSYVAFMDALVDSPEDVQLLHRYELVNNGVGSDEDFARLFSSMSREVIVDNGGSLGSVQEEAEKYCRRKCTNWKAELVHTYFRNPWSGISVVAAAFVILLTVVSTVFSVLQWKKC